MPVPDGWEWIEELPEGWAPPAELRSPTKIVSVNLVINMLSRSNLGNDVGVLVGEFLSEKSRFSIWFGSEAKANLDPPRLAQLLVDSEDVVRRVYEAWRAYQNAFDAASGLAVAIEGEYAALKGALRAAVAELAEFRQRNG